MDVLKESIVLLIALTVGVVRFAKLNRFHKVLFFQICTWFLLYLASYWVTSFQKRNHFEQNNHWVFNTNMLVETTLLLLACFVFFDEKRIRKGLTWLCVLLPALLLLVILSKSYLVFSDLTFTIESICLVILFSAVIFKSFYDVFSLNLKRPEIYASLGIVLYFGCNLPYFSLFSYLNQYDLKLSKAIHENITDNLSNVRYALLAVGFWITEKKE